MTVAAPPALPRRPGLRSLGLVATLLVAILAAWGGAGSPAQAANPVAEAGKPLRILGDASVTIEVTGVRSAKGVVRVAVCTALTFLKDACPYTASSRATVGDTVVTVPGVPPGVYAVQLFHDENDNDRVDRGLFGVPTEAIGFSNDASVGLTGPRFAKAAFSHGDESQTLRVALRRFAPATP